MIRFRDSETANYLQKIVEAEIIDPQARREFQSVIAYLKVRQQIVDLKWQQKEKEQVQ